MAKKAGAQPGNTNARGKRGGSSVPGSPSRTSARERLIENTRKKAAGIRIGKPKLGASLAKAARESFDVLPAVALQGVSRASNAVGRVVNGTSVVKRVKRGLMEQSADTYAHLEKAQAASALRGAARETKRSARRLYRNLSNRFTGA